MAESSEWQSMLWFLVAHIMCIDDAHRRRRDDLESTIETMDKELHAEVTSYITLSAQRGKWPEGTPQRQSVEKQLDRITEKLKERINGMS